MTQEWDDILSEPMAQLQPDLPAAAGGWRAVRSIEEVSPRPQQPPLTLPEPDAMLSVRLPVQPEEATPVSAPPPASLTGQLSLTWASRRRTRRAAEEEIAGESWPAWEPEPKTEPEPVEPTPLRLSLARPLRSLMRIFQRRTTEEPAADAPVIQTRQEAALGPVARRVAHPTPWEAPPSPATARPTLEGDSQAPLVLSNRPGPPPAAEPGSTPVVPQDTVPTPHRLPPPEPGPVIARATRPQDSVLRRWLARRHPDQAAPEEPDGAATVPASPALFAPVPLVARHEHAASEPSRDAADEESVGAPADLPHPAHHDEGSPLSPVLRERMEKLLDVPLKDVRVFRNSVAHEATHAHGADALAIGTDVHIAPGLGDPSTPSGQALLAHELSHVAARITGRREPAHLEEQHAQSLEHAVRSQPDLVAVRRPAASAPALEHRAQPRSIAAPAAAPPLLPSYSGGGFVGGEASSAIASGAQAVQRAPVGRIPAVADSLMGSGSGGSVTLSDSGVGEQGDGNEPGKDEPGGIDRVVEAVMRRLRREGSLERERRGSFRSEIGG